MNVIDGVGRSFEHRFRQDVRPMYFLGVNPDSPGKAAITDNPAASRTRATEKTRQRNRE